jgi:hypothetical protein
MIKPLDIESIEKKFGEPWSYWMEYMQSIGAKDLSHAEIAKKVDSKINDSWWAQTITVAYEQQSGRRKPGQREDGTYEASTTKMINEEPEVLIEKWTKYVNNDISIKNKLASEPKVSKTPKRHSWKAELKNSNKAFVAFEKMDSGKTQISVMEQRIKTENELKASKEFWKKSLKKFTET